MDIGSVDPNSNALISHHIDRKYSSSEFVFERLNNTQRN